MEYLSCFSGIGGLEATDSNPTFIEIDPDCRSVLARTHPNAKIQNDINNWKPQKFETICGGWPCQDISVAGKQKGLKGKNSGLFYKFLDIATSAGSKNLVAENVPNLLRMENGEVFKEVLRSLHNSGFKHISWRLINARDFGLPHHRNRVFIIASKSRDAAFTLFRQAPRHKHTSETSNVAGFYWTAGTHALNYSEGYIPTLKIGSSIGIPSPPAVHYDNVVRPISWQEALKLQGFDHDHFEGIKPTSIFKMAGNAVAKPVGNFVMDGLAKNILPGTIKFQEIQANWLDDGLGEAIPKAGYYDGIIHSPILKKEQNQSVDLENFLDLSSSARLSYRAASGLLKRLTKSGTYCPPNLLDDLKRLCSSHDGEN